MDNKEEYQDPDYHDSAAGVKKAAPGLSEAEKFEKIKKIIRREFANELEARESEVSTIDQRMTSARRILHQLRYALVNNYYKQERLQLTSGQLQDDLETMAHMQAKPELSNNLRDGQRRLHPSVRKLLGKETVNLEEIFKSREPRNKSRKNYSAMLQTKHYTIPEDSTKSLRPEGSKPEEEVPDPSTSKPKKVARHINPKVVNVFTIDEATRNKMKYRYRIIIGNTSKYAPAASRADRSTHKWLLYVRGPPPRADVSRVLAAVTVRLHHSYAPHHTVHLDKPPFHISRRGWGEFPAKVELHFALPHRNRPATVEHTIKLDRNYTGLQTLGAETIVDVWLYSTPDMLEFEYKDDADCKLSTQEDTQNSTHTLPTETKMEVDEVNIKQEVEETFESSHSESWMDFFSKTSTELNVDEMLVKNTNKASEEVLNATKIPPEEQMPPEIEIKKEIEEEIVENTEIENTVVKQEVIDNDEMERAVIKKEVAAYEVMEKALTGKAAIGKAVIGKTIENEILKAPDPILNQPVLVKKRIMKYIDPTTGKIYYLEMDRKLDLTKVQEIVIETEGKMKTAKISPLKSNGLRNVRKNKKPESLLKPEVQDLIKEKKVLNNFSHIENDHCYFSAPKVDKEIPEETIEDSPDEICLFNNLTDAVHRLSSVRMVVDYMLKKVPIICSEAKNIDFIKHFPFVVESEERYWKLDFAKRRNIEWSRAKLINKILVQRFGSSEKIWRTKQILIYSRLHGYYPIRTESVQSQPETRTDEWSSWNDLENARKSESNIREMYPSADDICTASVFDSKEYLPYMKPDYVDLTDLDEEIDVVSEGEPQKKVLPEVKSDCGLTVLPVEDESDRLRFLFIERMCARIGIELRNEDVGNGYSYSAVHAVILSAVRSFAEEMVRSALAAKLSQQRAMEYLPSVWVGGSARAAPALAHALRGCGGARLQALSARALAARRRDASAPL